MKEVMDLLLFSKLLKDVIGETVEFTENYMLKSDQIDIGQKALMLSSLEMVELIVSIETKYLITITDEDAISFAYVKDIIDFVNREVPLQQERNLNIEETRELLFGENHEMVEI